jgi:hypothetical protein
LGLIDVVLEEGRLLRFEELGLSKVDKRWLIVPERIVALPTEIQSLRVFIVIM